MSLTIRDLTVIYRDAPVLRDIDLDLPKGQLCAVVGPNGAGKSTLIKAGLGLVEPVSGSIQWCGAPLRTQKSKIGYVPQRSSVDWDFPTDVFDVVMMGTFSRIGWLRSPGKAERDRVKECLDIVGMADYAKTQISQLSGGQQQRVFFARALAQNADLTFMDEPFAGVDATTEESLLSVLKTLKSEGKTIVAVHHDLQTVRERFDHISMLNKVVIASGGIEATFTENNLKSTYGIDFAVAGGEE